MEKDLFKKYLGNFQKWYQDFEKIMQAEIAFPEMEKGCAKIKELIEDYTKTQNSDEKVIDKEYLMQLYTMLVYTIQETPLDQVAMFKNYSELTKKLEQAEAFSTLKQQKIKENNDDFILLNKELYEETFNELQDYFTINDQEVDEEKIKELAIKKTREIKGVIKNDLKVTDTEIKALIEGNNKFIEYIRIFSQKKYNEYENIVYLGKRTLETIKNQLWGSYSKEGKHL